MRKKQKSHEGGKEEIGFFFLLVNEKLDYVDTVMRNFAYNGITKNKSHGKTSLQHPVC